MIDSVKPHHEHDDDEYEPSDALLADGFEDALIGYGRQFVHDVAIYDYDRCINILMTRDGMSEEDAVEYVEYNVVGAWVGNNTPIFMHLEGDK